MSATDEVVMPSEPILDNIATGIGDDESSDGSFLGKAAVAIVAVLFTVAYWLLSGSRDRISSSTSTASLLAAPTTQKVNGVVLVGCCGAGKTVLLHQLTSGVAPATLPSMTPAYHAVELPSGKSVSFCFIIPLFFIDLCIVLSPHVEPNTTHAIFLGRSK